MSTAGENRWRQPPSTASRPPPSTRDRDRADRTSLSSSSTPPTTQQQKSRVDTSAGAQPQQPQQQQQQAPRENAWSTDRSRSQSSNARGSVSGGRGAGGGVTGAGNNGAASTGSRSGEEEKYVPVNGFNGEEVREFLRRGWVDAVAGDAEKTAVYHATAVEAGGAGNANARPAWGSKPSAMANGQDFWVQLKKQIAALEQGRGG